MKLALTITTLSLATLLTPQATAQTITDPFSNSANWGSPFAESGKSLVVTNGRMNFISSTTAGGGGGIARNTPFLTTTQDWSIKVDVHVNPFVITNEDHGVSVFLGVGKSSDWLGTHVLLGFDRDWWDPSFYGVNDDVQVNGSSVPGFFNINFLPSSDATLRLDYNAANQTITYYCDSDGSAGGGGWTTLGTTNIASGSYNLQLSPTDTLSVILGGWSEGHVVTNGQAYLDNLEITLEPAFAPDSIAGYTVVAAITNVNGTPIPAVFATNIYGVTTFTQIGPNADNTYSGTYTYVKTGADTGTIFIYKTAPPDQAGETTTNYLVFNSLLSGTFAHHYDFVDTPPTVQYGTFQVTQTNGLTGSLQVTISPTNAVSAGAQWQVDGGAWQNHSNVVSGLSAGNHNVSYKTISGWNTPSNQTVVVSVGATTLTNGNYTPQTGSLLVTIAPAAAVTAGAQWQVDGGAWQNHSNTVAGLGLGNHTVSYKSISGWNTPSNQTVTVSANLTTITNGTYTPQTGALLVTISPLGAESAGAQWRVDGGSWQNSGAVVSGLSPGYHSVNFSNIANWYAPWDQMVFVTANSTATANGVYTAVGGQPVFPAPINCSLQGGSFTMSYPVVTGQVYILQYTDDLTPPATWRPLVSFAGSTIASVAVNTTDTPTRYFRIRIGDSFPAVYSINVVGYVRRVIQPGLNLVANPLSSCGGNSLASLFPSCPQNSEIWLPDSNGSLNPGSVFSGGAWDSPNLSLQPGQGVGFVNPAAAFEVTFAGEVVGGLPTALPSGLSLVGSMLPVNGLLNFPAQQGDEITTWNATNQTSVNFEYLGGAWQATSPPITPGEAFWVQVSQFKQWTQPLELLNYQEVWEYPVVTGHPQNQTRIPGTTAHFTVSALGSPTLNYQWRKDGTNLLNSERIFGVNASTLAITNSQSSDAGNYTVVITNTFGSATSHVAVLTVSLPPPQIVTTNGSFGISNGVFGFQLTGLSGQTLVVEGSSNLTTWIGLKTNVLTGDSVYFSDPQWTNYPKRYYRVRSQ